MKPVPVKCLVLLFCISLGYTFLINRVNIQSIRQSNPSNEVRSSRSLVHNSTIYSIDNYWYVNQFKNLLEHGRFTVDIHKDKYEVRRAPVYPLFYGLHYYLFGEEKSYYYIRFTQALLLAMAVVALFAAIYHFTGNRIAAWLSAVIYGLYPAIPIATNYTMTESISSELVCFCLYFLSVAKVSGSRRYWWLAGIMFALATLCRPNVIFLSLSVAWLLWHTGKMDYKKILLNGVYFGFGALLLFAPWTIRNYQVTNGDIVFLEKYYGDPMDYGMPNIHLRKWISCWTNPADFTSENVSNTMQANIMSLDSRDSMAVIKGIMEKLPERAYTGNSRQQVEQALYSLYEYYAAFMTVEKLQLREAENKANRQFMALARNFQTRAPFAYFVKRPLIFLKSIIFQSNSTSMAFLDDYRQNLLHWIIKFILFVVGVFSWISLIVLFPWRKAYASFYWMSVIFIVLSLVSLIWILSYYEARYNFPAFPCLFGLLSLFLAEMYGWLKNKFIH